MVPLCKKINVSPVLGFLLAGVILGPAGIGVLKDLSDLDTLGEIGILFLLFEQVCMCVYIYVWICIYKQLSFA